MCVTAVMCEQDERLLQCVLNPMQEKLEYFKQMQVRHDFVILGLSFGSLYFPENDGES